jgi:hypothetical protein
MTKPDWLSHSALSQYLACSYQFKLQRIDELPQAPAWFFIGGSAVHLATQRMDERNAYPYSEDQLRHIWSEAFDEEIAKAYVGRPTAKWPDGQRYKYWDDRGYSAVKAWHEWRGVSREAYGDPTHIEEEVEFQLPSGIIVKGYIDRVFKWNDTFFPLDIKTGTRRPSSPIQLALYRLGIAKKLDLPAAPFGAWWMGKDGQEYTVALDHISLYDIDYYAQQFVKGVEQEVFIPSLGDACFNCPFTKQCFAHPDYEGE